MKEDRKYFQEKFSTHKAAPSLNVWKDIEAGLDKKAAVRTRVVFMRIAASLLILLSAAWFVWTGFDSVEPRLAENTEVKSRPEIVAEENNESSKPEVIIEEKQVPVDEVKPAQKKKAVVKPVIIKKKSSPAENIMHDPITANESEAVDSAAIKNEGEIVSEEVLLAENQVDSLNMETDQTVQPKDEILLADNQIEEKIAEDEIQKSDSRSVTIILRPKSENEALAMNEEKEDKNALDKLKDLVSQDLHAHRIRLGETPDLAFNRFKLRSN